MKKNKVISYKATRKVAVTRAVFSRSCNGGGSKHYWSSIISTMLYTVYYTVKTEKFASLPTSNNNQEWNFRFDNSELKVLQRKCQTPTQALVRKHIGLWLCMCVWVSEWKVSELTGGWCMYTSTHREGRDSKKQAAGQSRGRLRQRRHSQMQQIKTHARTSTHKPPITAWQHTPMVQWTQWRQAVHSGRGGHLGDC